MDDEALLGLTSVEVQGAAVIVYAYPISLRIMRNPNAQRNAIFEDHYM